MRDEKKTGALLLSATLLTQQGCGTHDQTMLNQAIDQQFAVSNVFEEQSLLISRIDYPFVM